MRPILQIEDEESDVLFFELAAEKAGLERPVAVLKDGRAAIDFFAGVGEFADRHAHPLPCLVVLDQKLPHVPGLEVLKYIRSQPALAPMVVIIFSSSDQDSDIHAAYLHGANSYIVKPSDPAELVKILRLIKDYWLGINRLA